MTTSEVPEVDAEEITEELCRAYTQVKAVRELIESWADMEKILNEGVLDGEGSPSEQLVLTATSEIIKAVVEDLTRIIDQKD